MREPAAISPSVRYLKKTHLVKTTKLKVLSECGVQFLSPPELAQLSDAQLNHQNGDIDSGQHEVRQSASYLDIMTVDRSHRKELNEVLKMAPPLNARYGKASRQSIAHCRKSPSRNGMGCNETASEPFQLVQNTQVNECGMILAGKPSWHTGRHHEKYFRGPAERPKYSPAGHYEKFRRRPAERSRHPPCGTLREVVPWARRAFETSACGTLREVVPCARRAFETSACGT